MSKLSCIGRLSRECDFIVRLPRSKHEHRSGSTYNNKGDEGSKTVPYRLCCSNDPKGSVCHKPSAARIGKYEKSPTLTTVITATINRLPAPLACIESAMAQREPMKVLVGRGARPYQITHRFMRVVGHPHFRQFAGSLQFGLCQSIAAFRP